MASPGPRVSGRGAVSSCLSSVGTFFKNRKLRKSSFYLLLLFLVILTTVDFVKLIRAYMMENVDTEMSIQFNETMTMPNLTFCIAKDHAWSHFKKPDMSANASEFDDVVEAELRNMSDKKAFLSHHWDYRMIMDAYLVIQALNSLERETTSMGALNSIIKVANAPQLAGFRKSMKKWLGEIEKRNVTFEEFQQKVGQETLERSLQRFQRLSVNEQGRQVRNKVRIMWLSQRQLCFQPLFDRDNFKPIDDQDQFFTLSIAHNTENVDEVDCMKLDVRGRPSDEARYLEGKGRAKDGFFDELCIGDTHEVEVEVRSVMKSLPEAEEENKKCLVYKGDGAKSEFECRSRCRMELIRKACSCTPHTLFYLVNEQSELDHFPLCKYEQCKIDPHAFNFSSWDEMCGEKCYPDCTQVRFHIEHFKRKAMKQELLQVTLFWGSFEYLLLLQKEKWSFSKFFSNLGGSLGVWLGLSVLSLVQFITFLLKHAQKKVSSRRKVSAVSAADARHRSQSGANANNNSNMSSSSPAGAGGSSSPAGHNPLGGGISMNPFGAKNKRT